jgi:hypothetical protein
MAMIKEQLRRQEEKKKRQVLEKEAKIKNDFSVIKKLQE